MTFFHGREALVCQSVLNRGLKGIQGKFSSKANNHAGRGIVGLLYQRFIALCIPPLKPSGYHFLVTLGAVHMRLEGYNVAAQV